MTNAFIWLACASTVAIASGAHAQSTPSAAEPMVADTTPAAPQASPPTESGVQDIIVTAQKRSQNLQDVPIAVSALSADTLEANRFASVLDLSALAPSLTVRPVPGGGGVPNFSLRGALTSGSQAGSDRGIGLYLDGVYLGSSFGSIFEIADIQQIEVLRGPQGTLFGRNATGGAISLTTQDPSGKFGLRARLSTGNQELKRGSFVLNTPSFGPFSALFAYTHNERRGGVRNLGGGTTWDFTRVNADRPTTFRSPDYVGGVNTDALSVKVRFDDGGAFTASYRYDYTNQKFSDVSGVRYLGPTYRAIFAAQPNQANLTPVQSNRPDAVNNWHTVSSRSVNKGHNLTMNYEISDQVTVKNIAAFRRAFSLNPFGTIDGSGGLINTGGSIYSALGAVASTTIGAPLLLQATTTSVRHKQISDEFQVNFDSKLVTLTAGAFYYKSTIVAAPFGVESFGNGVGLGLLRSGAFRVYPGFSLPFVGQPVGYGGRRTRITTESIAAFGQAEVHVTPEIDIVGGIRFTKDKRNGVDRSVFSAANPRVDIIKYSNSQPTYSAGVNYKMTPSKMIYAKYSTGFISGGQIATLTFEPEKAESWEGGIKADWFGRKLRTNLAVYHVDYSDLQLGVSGALLGLIDPTLASVTSAVVSQADARAWGFELDSTLAPDDHFLFAFGAGYTNFKFKEVNPLLLRNVQIYRPDRRPKWTLNASAQYTSDPIWDDVQLVARIDGDYRSSYFGQASVPGTVPAAELADYVEALTAPGRWVANGRLALEGFDLGGAEAEVALWSRNMFNNRTVEYQFALGANLVSSGFTEARTYGVDVVIKF